MIPANQRAALERLERRVGSYNRHHDNVLPQYNEAMSASYKRDFNETLILRQKYLESTKTKKTKKGTSAASAQERKMAGNNNGTSGGPATATAANAMPNRGPVPNSVPNQVWSLSSFKVSRQLLTNYLN